MTAKSLKPKNQQHTTTVLWPFVRDYVGELVPEETLNITHPSDHFHLCSLVLDFGLSQT